jgi:Leucine-rich repeat (LRR) protein
MRDIQKIKNNRQFSNLIHYKAYSKISIKERIKFCEEVLKMYNPQAPENFRINFNRQTQHLDLSNNSWLRAANCLQNFPAFSANLSGTSIRDFISFRAQKLTSLNVSHTNIVSLHTLGNDQIKELNISYTAIQNLAPLEKSSIEVINVSHSRIHNLDLYKHLPQIKKIYAHKGQFTEYEISQLPKNISLILTD